MDLNPLETRLGSLTLATPVMTASGTSGSASEINTLLAAPRILQALGAFVTKGVTRHPRTGNPEIRVVETRAGLLNSIGLQNKGVDTFVRHELPQLDAYQRPIIVNISAGSVDEFSDLTRRLVERDTETRIAGLEVNVSCPNIAAGGKVFGQDPGMVRKVVRAVRRHARRDMLIITKLSPNVADITAPAAAAIAGGTDALSMINTLRGTAIAIDARRFTLGNRIGGLSGPAIKPVGLFMVSECFRSIPECRDGRVPIIGIGGIATWDDALEYIMAGATAVGVGTAWFVDPHVFIRIRDGLKRYCKDQHTTLTALRGCVHD